MGYKVGMIRFRNADGIPVTSAKLNYSGAFEEVKRVVDYVYEKYVRKDDHKKNNHTRLYMYGCSAGATCISLYMANYADDANKKLDGCALFGTPWDIKGGESKFFGNFWGIYPWVFGLSLNEETRKNILPKMKKYLSEEDYQEYKRVLDTNRQGMDTLNRGVYRKMFGFKTHEELLEYMTIGDKVKNIKVPTFNLSAKNDQVCDDSFVPRR